MGTIRIYLLLIFLCCITAASAQTYTMAAGTISTCSGTFYDPGGTGNYGINANVTETFCSNSGNCIRVTFSAFNTESGYDYLYVYDGPTTGSTLIGTYSGTTVPAAITSSTGCLTFRFTSDGSTNRAGWTATFSCVTCPPPTYNMPGGTVNTCSGSFYDGGGVSGNYGNNQNVTTTFCSNAGNCLQVAFSSFNTELNYDLLYIYNGSSTASPLIGTYTGTNSPGTIIASSGCLTFRFTSDGGTVRAGWAATISCVTCGTTVPGSPQNCGGGATTICSNASFGGNSSGAGSVGDLSLNNQGCLAEAEHQSSWYFFSASASGNIQLSIAPSNTSDDYDFAIWGPMGTVSCPPSGTPLRCSYADGTGATGLSTGAGDNSEGASGNNWVESINATAGQVFILMIDNYTASSSPFTVNWALGGGASLNCTPLPVELLSFTAECRNGKVIAEWSTASESNSDYFTVERSADGILFESIGTVTGAGTSSSMHSYSYTDDSAPEGSSYYRLRQTDFDGHVEYFPLTAVSCSGQRELSIYPNPTAGEFVIEGAEQNRDLIVTDMLGQTVLSTRISSLKTKVDLSQLQKGIYFISIDSYGEHIVKKIIYN